jgi:hypothetical protein
MSLRDSILAADDIKKERITPAGWPQVEVRGLSLGARSKIVKSSTTGKEVDVAKFYPALVIACTFDPETGSRVFGEADRDALNEKSVGPIEEVAKVAMRLSGLSAEEQVVLEKNSGATPEEEDSSV